MLLLLSCAGPNAEDSASLADPAGVELGGGCPSALRFGGFEVAAAEGYSTAGGSVADAVLPVSVPTEVAAEGECRLLRRENPWCHPGCEAGQTCDLDGTCVPYPQNQDLGLVTLAGLAESVTMEATPPSNTYFDATLLHPIFTPDTTIELRADAFTLHGVGVETLLPDAWEWTIGDGALTVGWAAPTGLGRSSVELRLTVDQHGATPLSVVCDLADDGAGEVPAAVVEALLEAGVTGWPNGTLTRRTADAADYGAGCVDLVVSNPILIDVTVAGHTPCDSFDDCPAGQMCDLVLEQCL